MAEASRHVASPLCGGAARHSQRAREPRQVRPPRDRKRMRAQRERALRVCATDGERQSALSGRADRSKAARPCEGALLAPKLAFICETAWERLTIREWNRCDGGCRALEGHG